MEKIQPDNQNPLTPEEIKVAIANKMITEEGANHIQTTPEERKFDPKGPTNALRAIIKTPEQK